MRIAIGQLWQETNTFNPLPTTRADFETFGVLRGSALKEQMADSNELAKIFVEDFEAKHKYKPYWPAHIAYNQMMIWAIAVERAKTMMTNMSRYEVERVRGRLHQLPEMILPVRYVWNGSNVTILADSSRSHGSPCARQKAWSVAVCSSSRAQ